MAGPPGVFGVDEVDIIGLDRLDGSRSVSSKGFAGQTPGLELEIIRPSSSHEQRLANMEICTTCDVERKPVAAESLTNWYEMVFHKCPSCKSLLRVVERKPKGGKLRRLNESKKSNSK